MCRMALMNFEGAYRIESRIGLKNFFDTLVKSQGGHGNGYVIVGEKDVSAIGKGVTLTTDKIAERAINMGTGHTLIFHTRFASMGETSDANCHPFKEGKLVLASNGTENWTRVISKELGITDTEIIAKLVGALGLNPFTFLTKLISAFTGVYDGNPFWISNGRPCDVVDSDGALIIASEMPLKLKPKRLYTNFIWTKTDGMKNLDRLEVEKKTIPIAGAGPSRDESMTDEEQIMDEHRQMALMIQLIYKEFADLLLESNTKKNGFPKNAFANTLKEFADKLNVPVVNEGLKKFTKYF